MDEDPGGAGTAAVAVAAAGTAAATAGTAAGFLPVAGWNGGQRAGSVRPARTPSPTPPPHPRERKSPAGGSVPGRPRGPGARPLTAFAALAALGGHRCRRRPHREERVVAQAAWPWQRRRCHHLKVKASAQGVGAGSRPILLPTRDADVHPTGLAKAQPGSGFRRRRRGHGCRTPYAEPPGSGRKRGVAGQSRGSAVSWPRPGCKSGRRHHVVSIRSGGWNGYKAGLNSPSLQRRPGIGP
jgi:hypothetical protein